MKRIAVLVNIILVMASFPADALESTADTVHDGHRLPLREDPQRIHPEQCDTARAEHEVP